MNRPPLPPRRCTTCAATIEHHPPGLPCSPAEHSRPSRWLLLALAVGLAASIAGLILAPHHKPAAAQPAITEDDPRWDPRTMGDRCWGEPNPAMPDGIEIICADPEAYEAYVAHLAALESQPHGCSTDCGVRDDTKVCVAAPDTPAGVSCTVSPP